MNIKLYDTGRGTKEIITIELLGTGDEVSIYYECKAKEEESGEMGSYNIDELIIALQALKKENETINNNQ